MSDRNEDEEMDVAESVEIQDLVPTTSNIRMSLTSSEVIQPTVAHLRLVAQHLRLVKGRVYWAQANDLAKKTLSSEEFSPNQDGINAMDGYLTLSLAIQLKNLLELHPFYSKFLTNLYEKRATLVADESLRQKEIIKSVSIVSDKSVKCRQLVAKADKLFDAHLEMKLASPSFVRQCQTSIRENQLILREKDVDEDKDLKTRISEARKEVIILAEICSRLLAVAPNRTNLDAPRLTVRDAYRMLLQNDK